LLSKNSIRLLHPNSSASPSAARLASARSGRSRIHRQRDDELASFAGRALHRDLSPVRLDDVTHQGEPQSTALGVVNQRIANAIELLEYLVLLVRWNADTVVNHFQLDRAVIAVELHAQELFNLRILQRVVHQV
jgi:hypothetical protein